MTREDTFFTGLESLNVRAQVYPLNRPLIMGIVNLTPDSFYAESRHTGLEECLKTVEIQLSEGADWIDLGAVSTRPGAAEVSEQEETDRLIPCVEAITREFPRALISVDTFRSGVARQAVISGAAMVNDITGGEGDEKMFDTIAQLDVPYVMMHMRGNPQTMQGLTQYAHFPEDIVAYFFDRIALAHRAGVKDIIVDPGIGFAKTMEQNFALIGQLEKFKILNKPVLMGISRKSFIYKKLGLTPEFALNGTTALHMTCLIKGAKILRVHDVKEAVQVRDLYLEMNT